MIFSEIYSAYYNAVAEILKKIQQGETSERELEKIVCEKAFGESVLTIMLSLKNEKWQLVNKGMTTPIKYSPTMPLTNLQKRWIKALFLDKRIKLFDVNFDGLEGVEPLFTPSDYVVYDSYLDGDPYDDENYVAIFKTILNAIKKGENLKICLISRKGNEVFVRCKPIRLEYSEKDDKFRLIVSGSSRVNVINLSRIKSCEVYTGERSVSGLVKEPQYDTLILKIKNERNALERVMLHFAHFEKQAEKISGIEYIVKIKYNVDDISEMVIRVLSFGPLVEVLESSELKKLIIDKLKKQKNLIKI